MKRILVPVDFSDHTVNTCKYALEIAKKYGSEITLFHAYNDQLFVSSPSMPDAYDINPYSNAELAEDIKNDVQILINKLSVELMNILINENVKNVKIKTHISEGDLEYDLKQFCDDYHPSIIVIGTRGKGNSSNAFGVKAIHIINNVNWPVLAIPVSSKYKDLKNIMYTTIFEQNEDVLIRKLFNKFEAFEAKIHCVHIWGDEDYLKDEVKLEELKETFSVEVASGNFICDILENEDYHKGIQEYITKNNIDLIAFVPHKAKLFQRLFGQNNPDKELFNINLPLFSMRE
ncbi:MAG: universal stress protein [Bacteroidota bacterium]